MSGISRIQQQSEERSGNARMRGSGRELWLKDGDQVFATSAATGSDDDILIDAIELYTWRDGNKISNLLKHEDVDTSVVPSEARASRRFAFWAHVHEIIHVNRTKPEWEPVEGPGGRQVFKETVDDFKVIALPFGRSDVLWIQLVDLYNDWGNLNKGVMRIKRTGAALDTTYAIASTARTPLAPKTAEIAELPSIQAYYLERYSALWTPQPNAGDGVEVKQESAYADLPF
jgi:hypothetical protein